MAAAGELGRRAPGLSIAIVLAVVSASAPATAATALKPSYVAPVAQPRPTLNAPVLRQEPGPTARIPIPEICEPDFQVAGVLRVDAGTTAELVMRCGARQFNGCGPVKGAGQCDAAKQRMNGPGRFACEARILSGNPRGAHPQCFDP